MDSKAAASSPRPTTPKTVLISTFNGGVAVTLSLNPESPDPWSTHLMRRDGVKVRGTYMNSWDDALENFAQRCKAHNVEPDFSRLSELTIAETASALTDTMFQDAENWDRVYDYLKKGENGFPGLWHVMGRLAILGEANYGHLWSEGQVEYIDVLEPVVKQLVKLCECQEQPLTDEQLLNCWTYGLQDYGEQLAEERGKKRRWPDFQLIEDEIHNHERYRNPPAFFGLRRVTMIDNTAQLVHYVDADMIERFLVSMDGKFTSQLNRKWGLPILEKGEDGNPSDFHYLDGPDYWNEDSPVVDDLPLGSL